MLRGRNKPQVLLDLAEGDLTHEQIGVKYGVSEQAVHMFAVRPGNRLAIQAIKAEGMTVLAGMWSANRAAKQLRNATNDSGFGRSRPQHQARKKRQRDRHAHRTP